MKKFNLKKSGTMIAQFRFLCLMAVLCTSVQSWAVVHYVNASVSGGTGDGLSWPNAYDNLQSALTAALSGDEIWVAAGTYKPTTATDRSISFVMKDGVAIYGGFVGNETALNQRPTINPVSGIHSSTSLSGDIGTVNDPNDNSYRVIKTTNLNTTAVLDGFVVTLGVGDGSYDVGGGMDNNGGSPTIRNCSFQNNKANAGGAINNDDSSPQITNCSF